MQRMLPKGTSSHEYQRTHFAQKDLASTNAEKIIQSTAYYINLNEKAYIKVSPQIASDLSIHDVASLIFTK